MEWFKKYNLKFNGYDLSEHGFNTLKEYFIYCSENTPSKMKDNRNCLLKVKSRVYDRDTRMIGVTIVTIDEISFDSNRVSDNVKYISFVDRTGVERRNHSWPTSLFTPLSQYTVTTPQEPSVIRGRGSTENTYFRF